MPWTFAHPAAALLVHRFGRRSLPLSGLVVGSLSPDFGYYVGAFDAATQAHTLRGTLTICLPSACLLLVVLLRLRAFLVAPLPQPHRAAIDGLPTPSLWPLAHFAGMVGAIWIGALTHVAWDAFTHASGPMVWIIAPLCEELFEISGRRFATYTLLQHAGTLFGIAAIGVAYCRWLVGTAGIASCLRWRALREGMPLLAAALLSAFLGFASARARLGPDSSVPVLVFRGVVDATIAFAAAYALLAGLALRRMR